jgi:hypothetical protein
MWNFMAARSYVLDHGGKLERIELSISLGSFIGSLLARWRVYVQQACRQTHVNPLVLHVQGRAAAGGFEKRVRQGQKMFLLAVLND